MVALLPQKKENVGFGSRYGRFSRIKVAYVQLVKKKVEVDWAATEGVYGCLVLKPLPAATVMGAYLLLFLEAPFVFSCRTGCKCVSQKKNQEIQVLSA